MEYSNLPSYMERTYTCSVSYSVQGSFSKLDFRHNVKDWPQPVRFKVGRDSFFALRINSSSFLHTLQYLPYLMTAAITMTGPYCVPKVVAKKDGTCLSGSLVHAT